MQRATNDHGLLCHLVMKAVNKQPLSAESLLGLLNIQWLPRNPITRGEAGESAKLHTWSLQLLRRNNILSTICTHNEHSYRLRKLTKTRQDYNFTTITLREKSIERYSKRGYIP